MAAFDPAALAGNVGCDRIKTTPHALTRGAFALAAFSSKDINGANKITSPPEETVIYIKQRCGAQIAFA